ncbi:MAG: hypothetical protein GY854_19820 [Deltaproteobacteria bacterium]|nr:hypothetical protein [Deltaproteobacteria bacterium]
MSEETKPEPATGDTPSNADFRDTKLFNTMTKQVMAERDEKTAVQAELDALKANITEQEQQKQTADLEAQGQWETLKAKMIAEKESLLINHAKEILNRDLKLKLSSQFDEVFTDLYASKYEGDADGVESYVAELAGNEAYAKYRLGYEPPPTGATPPHGSTPAARSTGTTLKDRLNSSDPEVKKAAVSEHFRGLLGGELDE